MTGTVRLVARSLTCLAAAATLYVVSALALAPRIVALRWADPRPTALQMLRDEEGVVARPAGEWVPLPRVSHALLNAVLQAEDDTFPWHHGFDVPRMRIAASEDLEEGRFGQGASTITQQLVKNLFLDPARQPLRKLKEALLTVLVETAVPKPRILEVYLNVIEWGRGLYGIGAASRAYFGIPPAGLAPAQSALLAASISSPLTRNPAHVTRGLRWKQALLLHRMARADLIPAGWTR
jgi:monofunctional biosynthetic peptidoglycan transglycosylase